jgi:hypothetical protein
MFFNLKINKKILSGLQKPGYNIVELDVDGNKQYASVTLV